MEKIIISEGYSYYDFEVIEITPGQYSENITYVYNIYDRNPDTKFWTGTYLIRESDEWFDSDKEAKIAAIDHIDALESGER